MLALWLQKKRIATVTTTILVGIDESLDYHSLTFVLVFFQDGNFTRAEVMPADPPPAIIVGQSSFVDFGEIFKLWRTCFCGLTEDLVFNVQVKPIHMSSCHVTNLTHTNTNTQNAHSSPDRLISLGHILECFHGMQHCYTRSILTRARFSWRAYPFKQSWPVVFIVPLSFMFIPCKSLAAV